MRDHGRPRICSLASCLRRCCGLGLSAGRLPCRSHGSQAHTGLRCRTSVPPHVHIPRCGSCFSAQNTRTHICRRSQRHGTAEGCGRRSSVGLGGLQLFRIRYIIQYATACNTMSVCSMSSRQPLLSTLHTRSNRQLLTRPMVHVSSLEPESSCPPSCLRPFGHRPCPCEQGCRWPDFRACSREHRRPWGLLELAEGVGSCFCVTANRVCVCVCLCVCVFVRVCGCVHIDIDTLPYMYLHMHNARTGTVEHMCA